MCRVKVHKTTFALFMRSPVDDRRLCEGGLGRDGNIGDLSEIALPISPILSYKPRLFPNSIL